jgi:hypothetical protein
MCADAGGPNPPNREPEDEEEEDVGLPRMSVEFWKKVVNN